MKRLPIFALALIVLGLLLTQALIGGARMVWALPGYIAVAGGALLLLGVPSAPRGPSRQNLCLAAGLIFATYVVVRSRFSPVEYVARPDLFVAIAAFLVYWGTAQFFRTISQRLVVLFVLLVAAVAHTIVGFIQFHVVKDFMPIPGFMRPIETSYSWRASGFYIYPSHLAGLLEMIGLSMLALCCWARFKPWARLLAGHGAAICFAGVAITGSRGGYLSLLAGLLVFLLLSFLVLRRVRPGRTVPVLATIFVCFAGALGTLYFFMSDSSDITGRLDRIYDPENGRFVLWYSALEQFHLSPFIGTGSGSYLFLGRLLRSPEIQGDPQHVHCDYLELLAEYGLIGLGCALLFVALHLSAGFSALREILQEKLRPGRSPASNEMAIVIGTLASLTAILFHSIIDFNLHLPANALVVAFFWGILARPRMVEDQEDPVRSSRIGLAAMTAVPASALLVFAVRYLAAEKTGEEARVALRDERYVDAWQLANQASARDPQNPNFHYYAAEAQHYLAQQAATIANPASLHQGTVDSLKEALALSPSDTVLLLRYAQVLDLLERWPEAEAAYRRAIASDPNLGVGYAYFGLYWKRRKHYWRAQSCWIKANALGETSISGRGLAELGRLRKDPIVQAVSPGAFTPEFPM